MIGGKVLKVLVLDEEFPYPLTNGKRTRSFNLYRRLAERVQIRYLAYGEAGSLGAEAMKAVGITPIPVLASVPRQSGALFYLRLLANLLSPLPYIVTSHYSVAYRKMALSAIAEFQPDLIVCEWTPYAAYTDRTITAKILVCAHNVEGDIWKRYYENEANPVRRWYIREQWRKVDRFERAVVNSVDGITAVSDSDGMRLSNNGSRVQMAVIPNGVDLKYFQVLSPPVVRNCIVFTGSMDWRPNQDAFRYFALEILPLLKLKRVDVKSVFVGRNPPADIRHLAERTGIQVTGTVEDVRPYVESAAVYVVPLRIGGGSRLKILEALAMGRPIVSTTIGAEGLSVVHNQHVMLADDPQSFADCVVQLLEDPLQCRKLVAEGRRLVEARYGWDALAGDFESFIRKVVGGSHTGVGL